ncbi:hypothetical protein KIW84_057060 [Lathyrus oleraceus]|uniref:DUF659 domain-containing protein n=1 Tax=Pisum sativum TaxID=3888 RepID=A0A9D5AKJ2_PEA|nr:hypothetical protein KIW84_057060 [Pisum sativum]
MIDVVVEEVGEDNVVQVVTDNAANYKASSEILMRKRNKLYWTPCAAHCLDLMLEDLEKKISVHEDIGSRTSLISILHHHTKNKYLVRPGATRFATSYLTLGCFYKSIWNIIDDRWDKMLHRPLHAAAYYLNPQMHYGSRFKADIEVRKELQRFAIRILSLTCSSSGCERNWSAFEMIVQKKKGRRTFEIEFDDLGSDDDWLMDEDGDIEISDEDFIQMNQEQIQEDDIFVHDLEDEHDGGIDENEFDDDFEDENEDEGDNEDNNDPLNDYDQLQHELFGN